MDGDTLGEFYSLFQQTAVWISTVMRETQAGNKSAGRDASRFIRNSRILIILAKQTFPTGLGVDVPHLEWQLRQLESECHPHVVPSTPISDISKLHLKLDRILSNQSLIAGQLAKFVTHGEKAASPSFEGRTSHDYPVCHSQFPVAKMRSNRGKAKAQRVETELGVQPETEPANQRKNQMTITGLVLGDRPDEYTGKKGLVKQQVLNVIDQEPGVNRLTQPLEYSLSEDEKAKWAGKLQDKKIQLGIREIMPFGGKLRVRGQIVSVEGMK